MSKTNVLIAWEATEYLQREKNKSWYVWLALAGLGLAGVAVWQQWWSFLALVIVSVAALAVYTTRPPRMIQYELNDKGLMEGEKLFPYSEFKAFGVLKEAGSFAIVLKPRKRFSPQVKVYFPEKKGEKIVDIFGARLAMEEVKLDLLDKIVDFLHI